MLRASRRSGDGPSDRLRIETRGRWDLEATIGFLHAKDDPFLRRDGRGGFLHAVRTRAGAALVRLAADDGAIELEAWGRSGDAREEALGVARRLAGASADGSDPLAPLVRAARREPLLGEALRACRGMRQPQRPDPVLAISSAILAQQVTVAFARQVTHDFWRAHAGTVRLAGAAWSVPPAAEVVAGLPIEALRRLRFTRRKAEYVTALCGEVARGELDLARLGREDADRATEALVARRGIGPTTAAWLLMFGAGHPDAWPPGDVGLQRVLSDDSGRRPDAAATEAWGRRVRGSRSLAAAYLWELQRRGRGDVTAPRSPSR